MAAEREPTPPSGLQTLASDANALQQLLQLFTGTKGTTDTTSQSVAPGGVEYLMRLALEGNQGLAAVSSGQRRAGLYNSSTNQLLSNDLLARSAGEIARSTASTTVQRGAAPPAANPYATAGTLLAIQAGGKLLKDTNWKDLGSSVSNFFGGSPALDASSGFGYEMGSAYPDLGGVDPGFYDAFSPEFAGLDLSYDAFADLAGTEFAADAISDLGYESFDTLSDFEWSTFDFKDGGRVGNPKKFYADGGRVPSLYNTPSVNMFLNNRGRVVTPPTRSRITPTGVMRGPMYYSRDPYTGSLYSSAQGRENVGYASAAYNAVTDGYVPIASYVGAADRLKRGDTRGGFGQAAGTYVGGAIGAYFGGPAGAALGSSVGGYVGGRYADSAANRMQNALGNQGGETAQAFYDPGGYLTADGANSESWRNTIRAHADPLGSSASILGGGGKNVFTSASPSHVISKLFMDGGLVPGHDREGEDDVNINVSGGEVIIPTDVVDAMGAEFFDAIIELFHKPVKAKGAV